MPDLKKLFHRKKTHPISDPIQDIREKLGLEASLIPSLSQTRAGGWAPYETFCTTGRFSRLNGEKFVQHCAPTAITNLILTLHARYHYPQVEGLTPEEIFSRAAAIGRRRLLYINKKLFNFWGGSSVVLISLYLRACLKAFGIRDRRIRLHLLSTPRRAARALEEGKLLMLQVYFHKTYGTHSVVAYGLQNVQSADGRIRTYITLADGWADRPRYLALEDTRLLGYCTIS